MEYKNIIIKTPNITKKIGIEEPCFIIAEMSANHGGDIEKAKSIIHSASSSGADAIKLQTYTADTMTLDSPQDHFFIHAKDNPDGWKGKSFYELYEQSFTPWEWQKELKDLAESLGLVFFSTPFDSTAVDFLESINVPLYKVASYECTDIPLLKKIATTGKPIIMSVGFATEIEIQESVQTLKESGAKDIIVLFCTTSYTDIPTPSETNLRTMQDIGIKFNTHIGFSDNNGGIEIPILAAAMGATVIEKHLVLNNENTTLDDRFSLGPNSFKQMVDGIRHNEILMGNVNYGTQNFAEQENKMYRRSIFVSSDIKIGEAFTKDNICVIRPAHGLEPKYYEDIINKTAVKDIERGTPLSWEFIG